MKRLSRWLIGLLALVVVAVVADRAALIVTESRAVAAIEDDADVAGARLDFKGFPFLTQLSAGELDHVTGSADSATFGGLSVTDVAIDARGVQTSSPYTVSSGTASGAVSVASLQTLLAQEAGLSGIELGVDDGALVMSASVFGFDLAIVVVPVVTDPTTLGVTVDSVRMGGRTTPVDDLPGSIGNALDDLRVSLPLPAGMELDAVTVDGSAIRVEVSGTDVALQELVSS